MMRSITVIVVLALLEQVLNRGLAGSNVVNPKDSQGQLTNTLLNKFADKLVNRLLKACFIHRADLDNTTIKARLRNKNRWRNREKKIENMLWNKKKEDMWQDAMSRATAEVINRTDPRLIVFKSGTDSNSIMLPERVRRAIWARAQDIRFATEAEKRAPKDLEELLAHNAEQRKKLYKLKARRMGEEVSASESDMEVDESDESLEQIQNSSPP